MKKEIILKVIIGALAVMFSYASISKLVDYGAAHRAMRNQVFPPFIADSLTWLIPIIEIILVFLFVYGPTRLKALWGSLGLLAVFTLYIILIMTGVFGRTPCSCGGILDSMSYGAHLLFNLFFIALAFIGITIKRGGIHKGQAFSCN